MKTILMEIIYNFKKCIDVVKIFKHIMLIWAKKKIEFSVYVNCT